MKHAAPWLAAEQSLLAKEWPKQGIACAPMFPRHTSTAVQVRASCQGLEYAGKRKYPDIWAAKVRPTRSAGSGQIAGPTFRRGFANWGGRRGSLV